MRNEAIEAIGFGGQVLRVEFDWRGDRFGHVISIVDPNGQAQPLLESVEGTPDDDWPSSPPFQSLNLDTLADSRSAALLIGMAGRSHWSASVEQLPGTAAVVFDVACRLTDPSTYLGSRYRDLGHAITPTVVGGHCAVLVRLPQATVEVRAELDQPEYYRVNSISMREFEISAALERYKRPATVRWSYRIAIQDRSDSDF